MYLAYSLLLTLGILFLLPYFLFQALAHGKYLDGLRQRLGSLDKIKVRKRPLIWLHCVSVGETQAARPLVDRLHAEFPDHAIVVSTITITGQNLARNVFGSKADAIFYFPFDWRWTVRRALNQIKPDLVLIMETELWPNFLRECEAQKIPVVLVNGRISRQSFGRYQLISFFMSRILKQLDLAIMQSPEDAGRIQALGLSNEKLFTSGNLKFDADVVSDDDVTTELLRSRFNLGRDKALILAASTHDPEEKIVIESFRQLNPQLAARLIIAPRHPERFQEVAKLIEGSGISWSRRTNNSAPTDSTSHIILLDTIGELPALYPLVKIVFVGGSIVDRGGHNVLEPAATGACVITGANTHNFQAIVQMFNESEAIIQLPPVDLSSAGEHLAAEFNSVLTNVARCAELSKRAKDIVLNNKGATERTITLITPLLSKSPLNTSSKPNAVMVNSSGS